MGRRKLGKGSRVHAPRRKHGTVTSIVDEDGVRYASVLWDGEARPDLVDVAVLEQVDDRTTRRRR